MIRISIVGATGYTGGELCRLLLRHPEATLAHVTSESYAGKPLHTIHPFLKGRSSLVCEKLNPSAIAKGSDVVFLGLPHGAAAKTAAALLQAGTRVIDLSADFRIQDLATFEKWYGKHPVPKLIGEAVYGLPERYRESIRTARLVANPGCYATTSILAGLPLMAKGLLGKGPIIIDAKSGISGAGRKLESAYLYSEANETMMAYGLRGHRHHPEILQEWARGSKNPKSVRHDGFGGRPSGGLAGEFRHPNLIFVPQLAPMNRGIFALIYAPLKRKMSADALREIYLNYYMKEPFVHILNAWESPEVKAVTHTNFVQIGVAVSADGKTAILMGALDNLVKGASGQAIQNMNLMFGMPETTGLL